MHKLKEELLKKKSHPWLTVEILSLQMVNNVKIKKGFLSGGQIQETLRILWSKDDVEVVTINPLLRLQKYQI